jgi:hypothetical protein
MSGFTHWAGSVLLAVVVWARAGLAIVTNKAARVGRIGRIQKNKEDKSNLAGQQSKKLAE